MIEEKQKIESPATLSTTTANSNHTNQLLFQKPQTSVKPKKSKFCCVNQAGCSGLKPYSKIKKNLTCENDLHNDRLNVVI